MLSFWGSSACIFPVDLQRLGTLGIIILLQLSWVRAGRGPNAGSCSYKSARAHWRLLRSPSIFSGYRGRNGSGASPLSPLALSSPISITTTKTEVPQDTRAPRARTCQRCQHLFAPAEWHSTNRARDNDYVVICGFHFNAPPAWQRWPLSLLARTQSRRRRRLRPPQPMTFFSLRLMSRPESRSCAREANSIQRIFSRIQLHVCSGERGSLRA